MIIIQVFRYLIAEDPTKSNHLSNIYKEILRIIWISHFKRFFSVHNSSMRIKALSLTYGSINDCFLFLYISFAIDFCRCHV